MEAIKKHLLGDVDEVTYDQLIEVADAIEKIVLAIPEGDLPDEPPTFEGYEHLPEDLIYVKSSDVVPYHVQTADGREITVRIPRFFRDERILSEFYSVVIIEGQIYHETDPSIVRTKDTNRLMHMSKAKRCYFSREYYEKTDEFIHIEHRDVWVHKDKKGELTKTVDLNILDLKRECYKSEKNSKYYSHYELSPDYRFDENNPPRFNLTKKRELKQTGIGLEFELENSVPTSIQVLKNKDLRERFLTERDGSLNRTGNEFVSVPLQYEESQEIIDHFFSVAKDNSADPSERCGFHVHISLSDFDYKDVVHLIEIGRIVENEMFDLVDSRRRGSRFCRGFDDRFLGFKKPTLDKCGEVFYGGSHNYKVRPNQSKWAQNDVRHYWMNIDRFFRFRNEKQQQTVEFRLHEATLDAEKFKNFVKLCYWLVVFAKSGKTGSLTDIAKFSNDKSLVTYVTKSVKPKVGVIIDENETPNIDRNLNEVI